MRSCCGLASTSRGLPLSTITPAVHEHQLVGDLAGEAHLVGDHDHRHALEASFFITPSTSPTSSGSSADVGSSNSISLGSIASALAIATRCC